MSTNAIQHRNGMTASSACSPELWSLLTNDLFSFVEGSAIVARDHQPGEIAAAKLAMEPHLAPCGSQAVIAALVPLVTLYGVADKSEQEWATFWGFYTRLIGQLPAEAVRKGVDDYVSRGDSNFFPKPGPLHEICNKHALEPRMALSRLKRALALTTGAAA